jgi:uncharacterized protein (TIGR02646 family)
MRRLHRNNLMPPATWAPLVVKSFADHAVFLQAAEAFERLDVNSAERRAGFIAFVKQQGFGCFRVSARGKVEFKNLWGKAKEAIAKMSDLKCAYCEGGINASRAGQVEHFLPKSLFPRSAYDWNNYFLGCAGCNGAKSDKWPNNGNAYLRPDEGLPEAEFQFAKDGTVALSGTASGAAAETLRDFDLNRKWLVRRRRTHIRKSVEALTDLFEVYELDATVAQRLIGNHLQRLAAAENAYSVALQQCASAEWEAFRSSRV